MAPDQLPLITGTFLLKKYSGKGGWTYASLPAVDPAFKGPGGLLKVRGFIDHYALSNFRLFPVRSGGLFMPVKTAIRKSIGKEAGDTVKIELFADHGPVEIPEEFMQCLQIDNSALLHFQSFSDDEKQAYINWIYGNVNYETQVGRMTIAVEKISRGRRQHERS